MTFCSKLVQFLFVEQMVSSDEQLKQEKGGESDIMDAAMAFGEGPAKELFGVELSAP